MVRHKNRYIVVEVNPLNHEKLLSINYSNSQIYNTIVTKLEQLHGDFGVASVRNGFTVKYMNDKTRIAVIKVRHGPHKLIASCLPFINNIDKKQVYFTTLYTGATIRQCFKFILNYQQEKVDRICATLKTEEEKEKIQVSFLNFETSTF